MRLHNLKPTPGSRHRKKRVGRGESSGWGKTAGRGHKGQKSRAGAGKRASFEGGQMPIYRTLPKKGFSNERFRDKIATFNVSVLQNSYSAGDTVSDATLREKQLLKGKKWDGIKVLGDGNIDIALNIEVDKISKVAQEKIEKCGGTVKLVGKLAPKK